MISITSTISALPQALAEGINRTAFQVREALQAEMKQVFDRPTPWALSTVWVERATPDKPVAVVGPNDYFGSFTGGKLLTPWETVFEPNIYGGTRPLKRSEIRLQENTNVMPKGWFAVPSEQAPIDMSTGNLRRGVMTQILSWFRALEIGNRVEKKGSRRNKLRRMGAAYFAVFPGTYSDLPYGIWQRNADGSIIPILYFEPEVKYRPIFDYFGIGQNVIDRNLENNINIALNKFLQLAD